MTTYLTGFTLRIMTEVQGIAVRERKKFSVVPKNKPPDENREYVLAATNQLLVNQHLQDEVERLLARRKVSSTKLTSLFEGLDPLPPPDIEDVVVLQVSAPAGTDVFVLTDELRKELKLKAHPELVSPNHILIPASLGWGCPDGPPHEAPGATFDISNDPVDPTVPVTVIDSGFQWNPAWGDNPLGQRFNEHEAEQLSVGVLAGGPPWVPGTPDVSQAQWQNAPADESPEVVPQPPNAPPNAPHRLDALAGHANFVSGLILHGCPNASVAIRNHNGAFVEAAGDALEIPTEIKVARSLCRSADARVIDLEFAFLPAHDMPSSAWSIALRYLAWRRGEDPVVVAPAGNQTSTTRRYPAALNAKFPGQFPNVLGVASSTGTFTNRGPWVSCSADGSDVLSVFLKINMELEDGDANKHDFTPNCLATWNGTSFAAPKVAAAIACELANGAATPMAAWQAVQQTKTSDDPNLGYVLPL